MKMIFTSLLLALSLVACTGQAEPAPTPEPTPTPTPDPPKPEPAHDPYTVMAKETPSSEYKNYTAYAVECLEGFTKGEKPETDSYGGWKTSTLTSTGYFRVEKVGGRWMLISPDGHPMLSAQVGNFVRGQSAREIAQFNSIFKTDKVWAEYESTRFKGLGFTGFAGSTSILKDISSSKKIPYCVFFNPMTTYSATFKKNVCSAVPAKMPVVFDSDFDAELATESAWLAAYKNDPYCVGITYDDELLWTYDMLMYYLTKIPAGNINRVSAQSWFDSRKGKSSAAYSEANEEDKKAFVAYCLDVYLDKCLKAIRKVDANHMFMGTRFYSWKRELVDEEMMKVAGKYVDLLSINHFEKWEPEAQDMSDWTLWSGRPFAITSFDVKGEDSGLGNTGGLGWVVPTQADRGLFYQNFILNLVKGKNCVLWQWYTYQDNDPEDSTADPSNKDSNKGIVKWDFNIWTDLSTRMKEINEQLYNLTEYYK